MYGAIAANNYHTLFKVRQNVWGIKATENCDMCAELEDFAWIFIENNHFSRQ